MVVEMEVVVLVMVPEMEVVVVLRMIALVVM